MPSPFRSVKRFVSTLLLLAALFLPAAPARLQTGSVTGVLRDGSGGILRVAVALVPATGEERAAVTGSDGKYSLPACRRALTCFAPRFQASIL